MALRFAHVFARELGLAIARNRVKDQAAMLGFWSLLALFPFMIFLLTLMGFVPMHGLDQEVLELVHNVMPDDAAALFDRTMREVLHRQRGALLIVSLAGAVWTASGGMGGAMAALNLAHGVAETRPWWRRRLLGMAMTTSAALAITVATMFLLIGPNVLRWVLEIFDKGDEMASVWRWLRYPLATLDLLVMLACLYHFLPNTKNKFKLITPGSALAVLLWIAASVGFNFYVSRFHKFTKTYGTLGAAIILLTWLYLSALVVLLGAEINAAIERTRARIARAESAAAEQVEGSGQVQESG